jgi:sugar/nucleoside kinase (ribokinase family)
MARIRFAVLGNPVVDAISHLSDKQLESLHLKKGDSNTLDHTAMFGIGAQVEVELFQSGGAAGNLAYTLSKLGHAVCFLGPLGTDPAGRHFFAEMVGAGLALNTPKVGYRTTELFVFLTPDGARTMVQPQPPAPSDDDDWLEESLLAGAEWLVMEGYLVRDWPTAAQNALVTAREHGTRAVLHLPAPQACTASAAALLKLVESGVDLVIGNIKEYEALLAKASDAQRKALEGTARVVTHGAKGAEFIPVGGKAIKEVGEAVANPRDNTGAGDAFAAAFLAVYAAGGQPAEALRKGNQLGAAVVQHLGPRLPNPQEVWQGAA